MAIRPILGYLALLVFVAALSAGYARTRLDAPGPLAAARTVIIPKGSGGEGIARRLSEAGVIADPRLFRIAARIAAGRQGPLRAGEYEFPARISTMGTIHLLQSGRTVARRLTIPEGLTVRQIAAILNQTDGLEGAVGAIPAEGSLLPETYHFSYGDSRQAMVERMRAGMKDVLVKMWATRSVPPVIKTPEEALVLASIVEKETGVAAERPKVAAVFVNRLKAGMRLQSDPTVIYGLSAGEGAPNRALARADLEKDSPFNTYTRVGLPPGPIANPGRASIAAVLNPAVSDDLYFVADGSGGHVFARTLEEHNRNVARWRKIQNERGNAKDTTAPK